MTDPAIQAGVKRQAELDAAKAAFLAKGGIIQVVPIIVRSPSRAGYNNQPAASPEPDSPDLIDRVKGLIAAGGGIYSIARQLSWGTPRLNAFLTRNGLRVQHQPYAARPSEEQRKLADLARVMLENGQTQISVAYDLKISRASLRRLVTKFNLPTKARNHARRTREKRTLREAW
ncbi:hypothetical protein [Pseudomonas sp. Marseille-QA0892]